MSRPELDAAGITDPALRASYAECRRLLAQHGKTYHLATLLLPPAKRPFVQALYGFARYTDEIVDDLGAARSDAERAAELTAFSAEVLADLRRGYSTHPITMAMVHTVRRWDVDPRYVEAFLASMRMDLDVREYATYADLMGYMYGSAAVIGLQMVPILGHPTVPRAVVEPYAHDLGVAFQLANFIRDVGEDLRRGRIYFPLEDLATFGVDRAHLERGVVDGPVRRLLAFQIARCREVYRAAWPGLRLLEPTSRDCMETAFRLYGGILDAVERADYQVFDRRVTVGNGRRAAVALPALARATLARRRAVGTN